MKPVKLVKKVGRAIARQRKLAGLTQAQVSRELGIETETVSRLETSAISATLERLEQLSELFNCPVEVFFQEENEDVEGLAKHIAGMLKALKAEEQKLLVKFVSEAVKLFKKRK